MSVIKRGRRRATGQGPGTDTVLRTFTAEDSITDVLTFMQEHPTHNFYADALKINGVPSLKIRGKRRAQPRDYQGRMDV